ncbi:outer membrane beta-barrel protein [Reichenbachiella agariperforans]|uniref:outer membrane beta-barrel protein n=1 Tax=Reichenbachiella agariperforans TaxID=156994 RepID=UPI001C0832A9|nr:outer membrane beta-barrel protein [Reichenbachiella agariperforans]MBU2914733.1 porin family protein [Reichenbachiella agariperforans]
MMKSMIALIGVLLTPLFIHAQAIEFSGYGGYMLSGKAEYYRGEVDVKNTGVWGLTLGYDMGNGTQVQFLYTNSSADSETVDYDAILYPYHNLTLKMENFHIGVEKSLGGDEVIRPYGVFGLGLTSYAPQEQGYETRVFFSMGLGAGVKIFPTEKIGFKMQARMFMPLLLDGVGIYCASGSGCGGGSSFAVPIVHGEFSGGVIFRLEK